MAQSYTWTGVSSLRLTLFHLHLQLRLILQWLPVKCCKTWLQLNLPPPLLLFSCLSQSPFLMMLGPWVFVYNILLFFATQKWKDCGLVTGNTVNTSYLSCHFYHLIRLNKIFLADGTLFVLHDSPNEKALTKASVCYVHPLWCLYCDPGRDWGFATLTTSHHTLLFTWQEW